MSEDSWTEWDDSYPWPSSWWPSEKLDIDVDRNMMRKVGQAMEADLGDSNIELPGSWRDGESSVRFKNPGWVVMHDFEWGLFGIADELKHRTNKAHNDYSSIADMIVASSINYDRAEGIIEANRPHLEKAINGTQRVDTWIHGTHDGDLLGTVSKENALSIRNYFDNLDLEEIAERREWFLQMATKLTEWQDACQQRAHDLSNSWKSPAAKHALEAMRKICGAYRSLAYAAGVAGSALAMIHPVLKNYKTNFESIVNIDDKTFGESLSDFFGEDEDDRARSLLLEVNAKIIGEHSRLPLRIRTALPNVIQINGQGIGKVEINDESFWKEWERLMPLYR